MVNASKSPNFGTSNIVEDFLKQHIGEAFTAREVASLTGLDISPVSSKLTHLTQQGRAKKDKTQPGYLRYFVLPEILEKPPRGGSKKKNGEALPKEKLRLPIPTPQAQINLNMLQQAKESPALDIPGMMQHIINVDEQNKVYRNALENIALILEQAGIIETTD